MRSPRSLATRHRAKPSLPCPLMTARPLSLPPRSAGSASSKPSWRFPERSTRSFSIRTWPQSLYPVIETLTGQGIDVRHACRTLSVSESGFYAWKGRPTPPRTLRRIWLAGEIATVHKASGGTYGAHRVTAELKHGRGIKVGQNAVELIMRELGIKGLLTRRLPKGSKVGKFTSLDSFDASSVATDLVGFG